MADRTTAGLTVPELARRYRVGQDKVRGWIRRGELRATNTADARCGRPRWVVSHDALAAFEAGRAGSAAAKTPRRRRTTGRDYVAEMEAAGLI